jgi:hypothetical protein
MPPPPDVENRPITDPDHLLPAHKKEIGPTMGIIIILVILIFGAFYLWSARLEKARNSANQASYIQSGTTTLPDINE